MKLDRLLAIIILLLNRGRMSAKSLSQHFEVSERTIYRDIDAINQAGIPIVAFPGRSGGYGIMGNFTIDKQLFTPTDMSHILMSLSGIQNTLDDSQLSVIIEKFKLLLPHNERNTIVEESRRLMVDLFPGEAQRAQHDVMKRLKLAIMQDQRVAFAYLDAMGRTSSRTIEPIQLVVRRMSTYVYGYCQDRNDYRMFRLSRMSNLTLLNEFFDGTVHIPFLLQSAEKLTSGIEENIVLKFNQRGLVKALDAFPKEFIETNEEGISIVQFEMPINDWLCGFILSFGEDAEVIEPLKLRKMIKEKVHIIYNLYKP